MLLRLHKNHKPKAKAREQYRNHWVHGETNAKILLGKLNSKTKKRGRHSNHKKTEDVKIFSRRALSTAKGKDRHSHLEAIRPIREQSAKLRLSGRRCPVRQQQLWRYLLENISFVILDFLYLISAVESPLAVMKASCAGVVRGTIGTKGQVEVNYLRLDLSGMPKEAFHYDVTITPDRPKKFLRPAFDLCQLKAFPDIAAAFDGSKSCYTLQRLPTPMAIKVTLAEFRKECQVEIKETIDCVVDMDSLRT